MECQAMQHGVRIDGEDGAQERAGGLDRDAEVLSLSVDPVACMRHEGSGDPCTAEGLAKVE